MTPAGAAIRAYGPSRYYPAYNWTPRPFYGAPTYGMPYNGVIYLGAQSSQTGGETESTAQPRLRQSILTQESQVATLKVTVPEDARVFVNGHQMTTPGTFRRFESAGLEPGVSYNYEVRSEVERDGQIVADTQHVVLSSGATRNLVFDLEPAQSVLTSLTVHVPDDARVELAGSKTGTTGQVRTYTTGGLTPGQTVPDYTIRVSVERNGHVQTKEKTIQLVGGRDVDLSFQFDSLQLADVR